MYDEFKSIYGETIMAKIFIVEDNPDIIHSTTQELNKWQHDVITVNDWQNVANEILATNPDLVLFDITLPTFDGFYWIQEVRKHSQVPIIVISAAEIDTNVMHAVAAGADDYIMKPFAMTVLLAKIQALLRRNKQTTDAEEIMWDHNSFNPLTNILTNENGTAQLTPTEGAMLQVLLSHRNKTVSKEQLLQWLWQGGKYLNENTLNVNISRLRTKLSTIGLRQCIHTERGLGYPTVFWGDVIRFSLPFFIVWLIGSGAIKYYRLRHLNVSQLDKFTPTNMTEGKLVELLQDEQAKNIDTIRQLQATQHEQLDHLELFTHEIKNYLTSINAAAENSPTVASTEVKKNIHQANYYLNLLLNDERLAINNHDYDFQWIDIANLINNILQQNSAVFIHKQLIPELTGLDGIKVLTDRKWLHFCIEQLLSNAIKYSFPNSTINISWEMNSLRIADHGCGISMNDLPRIFDNGFTGKNGHQTTAATGMGLYLVKKVTEYLNFKVSISSVQSQGTTAILSFLPDNIRSSN